LTIFPQGTLALGLFIGYSIELVNWANEGNVCACACVRGRVHVCVHVCVVSLYLQFPRCVLCRITITNVLTSDLLKLPMTILNRHNRYDSPISS
jgi:hypothetical protein